MKEKAQTDTYYSLQAPSRGLYKAKGSKFIALAHPVETREAALELLEDIRKEYHDARHHCYAWVLGPNGEDVRMNDDGEPSGTAGRPIHGQILSAGLTQLLIVVVRYFGGTKLGVRGLIDAYKGASKDAIEQGRIVKRTRMQHFELRYGYPQTHEVMNLLKKLDAQIIRQDFGSDCRQVIACRLGLAGEASGRFSSMAGVVIRSLSEEQS